MKLLLSAMLLSLMGLLGCRQTKSRPDTAKTPSKSIYDYTVKTIDGNEISLSQFKGKKILIVNTASKCGYTPQYKDLQALYDKYSSKLVILGFPANDFLKQEPGSNKDISEFCSKNYGVTFPMFEKTTVVGKNKSPLYQWLTSKDLNGWNDKQPSWNFCKYLIDENGNLLDFFSSAVNPMSADITSKL